MHVLKSKQTAAKQGYPVPVLGIHDWHLSTTTFSGTKAFCSNVFSLVWCGKPFKCQALWEWLGVKTPCSLPEGKCFASTGIPYFLSRKRDALKGESLQTLGRGKAEREVDVPACLGLGNLPCFPAALWAQGTKRISYPHVDDADFTGWERNQKPPTQECGKQKLIVTGRLRI